VLDAYKWVPASAGSPVMSGDSVKDCIVKLLCVPRITKGEGVCEAVLRYYFPLFWWNPNCVRYKGL